MLADYYEQELLVLKNLLLIILQMRDRLRSSESRTRRELQTVSYIDVYMFLY